MVILLTEDWRFQEICERIIEGCGFDVEGKIVSEFNDEFIDKLDNPEILVIEIGKETDKEIEIIKKIKDKFKNCKILLLISEINQKFEYILSNFNINSYLISPFLYFHLIRAILILSQKYGLKTKF